MKLKKRKKGGFIPLTKYKILKLDEKEFIFTTNITGNKKKYIYIPKVIGTMLGTKRVKVNLSIAKDLK